MWSSSVRRLRSGTSRPSSAAAGARPTSSACATGAWRATAATTCGRRHARVVLDVGGDLDEVAELEAERADARQPLGAPLADQRRHPPRVLQRAFDLDVERDERRPGGDERRARGRVQPRRPVVGREAGQRAWRAQARASAPARERAVQIDGQAEVAAEPVGEQQRLGGRGAALGVGAVHDRRDVDHADARVQPSCAVRSIRSTASRAPSSSASCSRPGSPASVKTLRWWCGSLWTSSRRAPPVTNAAPIASSVSRSRPSETLGTASSRASPPARSRRSATASPGRRRARASSAR